jgi:phage terminase large subunit
MQHHVIDYYGNFGHDWSHYLEQIQGRKYRIGKIYLPHDAGNDTVVAPKSVYTQTVDAYPNQGQVVLVPRTPSVINDINAVRLMFPRLWFNEERCADGLQGLAHYRYEVDTEDARDISPQPLHDWASHPADALRCYVMGLAEHGDRFTRPQFHQPLAGPDWGHVPMGQRWMG